MERAHAEATVIQETVIHVVTCSGVLVVLEQPL